MMSVMGLKNCFMLFIQELNRIQDTNYNNGQNTKLQNILESIMDRGVWNRQLRDKGEKNLLKPILELLVVCRIWASQSLS